MASEDPRELARESSIKRLTNLFHSSGIAVVLGILAALMGFVVSSVNNQGIPERLMLERPSYQKMLAKIDDSQKRIDRILNDDADKLPPQVIVDLATIRANLQDTVDVMALERLVPARNSLIDKIIDWIAPPANAAEKNIPQMSADAFSTNNYIRPAILLFMLLSITVFFISCIVTYFRTTDPERLKFAMNSIQTILGFYIGVFTGLLGLQA